MHAILFRSSAKNRKLLKAKYRGMPTNLPRTCSLNYDPAQPLAHRVTLTHLKQLALCGFVGLQRIPRHVIQR